MFPTEKYFARSNVICSYLE